jgi:hypothetical protein
MSTSASGTKKYISESKTYFDCAICFPCWDQGDQVGRLLLRSLWENFRSRIMFAGALSHGCALILTKKWVGLHFGQYFRKLIWSPWLRCTAAFFRTTVYVHCYKIGAYIFVRKLCSKNVHLNFVRKMFI